MFLIKKSKITGDYSIEASEHGINEFWIVATKEDMEEFWIMETKEEMEKITDELEKACNKRGE